MIRLRRPTSRFLIAATALAAASPHAALLAQQAHTPPALDVAGMDRSVKPGDNFFAYANGTWLAQTEIPADRSSYSTGAIVAELTDRRTADLIQEAAKSQAARRLRVPEDRRLLRQLHGLGRHRRGRPQAAAADARLHRRDPRPEGPRPLPRLHPPRRRGRVQRHELLHREPVRPLGRAGPGRSDAVLAVPAPGRARHARPRLLRGHVAPRWPRSAPSTRQHIAAMLGLAKVADAGEEGRGHHAARDPHRQGALRAASSRATSPRGTTTGPGPSSAARRRGSTGRRISPPPGSAKPARFVVWQPSAVTGISALTASEPLETWKDYLTFHAIESRVAVLPAAFVQPVLRVLRPGAERRPEAARPLEARGHRHQRRARLRRRPALHRALLPGRGEGAGPGDGGEPHRRVPRAHRPARLDGACARRRRPRPSSRCSRSASGIPTSGPTTPGSRSSRATRSATRSARRCSSYRQEPGEAGQPGGPRRVGDDAADRERGEPAGDERDELPRRHPAAAVLRSQAADR